MPHEHRVDDVVEHLHGHAGQSGDGELQQQLEGVLGAHAGDLRLSRVARRVGFGRQRSGRVRFVDGVDDGRLLGLVV